MECRTFFSKKRKSSKRDVIPFTKVFDRRYPTVPSRRATAESRSQGVFHRKNFTMRILKEFTPFPNKPAKSSFVRSKSRAHCRAGACSRRVGVGALDDPHPPHNLAEQRYVPTKSRAFCFVIFFAKQRVIFPCREVILKPCGFSDILFAFKLPQAISLEL